VRHFAAGIRERAHDPDLWAALLRGEIMGHPSTIDEYGDEILLPRVMLGASDVRCDAPTAAGQEVRRILATHEPRPPANAAELTGIMEQVAAANGLASLPELHS
jgi:hypothetical protein